MEKCSPVEMRKNITAANTYKKLGMDFVVIPAKNHCHKRYLIEMALFALLEISNSIEKEESNVCS